MWNLINSKDSVIALYNGVLPQFQDVTIQELSIITGEDIELDIRFDTCEMPSPLPLKWKAQEVNTIQFIIGCVGVKFNQFAINSDFTTHSSVYITTIGSKKQLTIQKSDGTIGIQIETAWIYVKSMTGYCSTTLS